MDYEVKGVRPRGRSKKTWNKVVEKIARLNDYAKKMAGP